MRQVLLFDDSFEHYVYNETDQPRLVRHPRIQAAIPDHT